MQKLTHFLLASFGLIALLASSPALAIGEPYSDDVEWQILENENGNSLKVLVGTTIIEIPAQGQEVKVGEKVILSTESFSPSIQSLGI